jgi:hypothetical protein
MTRTADPAVPPPIAEIGSVLDVDGFAFGGVVDASDEDCVVFG